MTSPGCHDNSLLPGTLIDLSGGGKAGPQHANQDVAANSARVSVNRPHRLTSCNV